jgi:hypothetical protein
MTVSQQWNKDPPPPPNKDTVLTLWRYVTLDDCILTAMSTMNTDNSVGNLETHEVTMSKRYSGNPCDVTLHLCI